MGAIARTTAADRRSSVRIAALLEPGTGPMIGHFLASEAWESDESPALPAPRAASGVR